ncbi:MAG: ParA family protein [Chloroflexota bacterium]
MTHIIAITNEKGGVGKTTTAVHLACGIRRFTNASVLVVDIGPQANTSSRFMPTGFVEMTDFQDEPSIVDVLVDGYPLGDALYSVYLDPALGEESETIDILPAKLNLNDARDALVSKPRREYLLADAFLKFNHSISPEEAYDFVIIDCPPSKDDFNRNALVASTHVLVPFMPGKNNLSGIATLQASIQEANELQMLNRQPSTSVLGTVITIANLQTNLFRDAQQIIKSQTNYPILGVIPRLVAIEEAEAAQLDVFVYQPKSKGAAAYRKLVENVLHTVGY